MSRTKVGLMGYGKMGKAIEQVLIHQNESGQADWDIVWRLSSDSPPAELSGALDQVDAVFEFTSPRSAPTHIRQAMDAGIVMVCGSTGWQDQLPAIEEHVLQREGALLYAANFSIGVNIFFALQKMAAEVMASRSSYNVSINETHHSAKLDAPSGTAIQLAELALKALPQYRSWSLLPPGEEPSERVLPISCHRTGDVPGTHQVLFSGPNDQILLEHRAHNRQGFAHGAVEAMHWLIGRRGLFTMSDMLGL